MEEYRDYTASHWLVYPPIEELSIVKKLKERADFKIMDNITFNATFNSINEKILTPVILINGNIGDKVIGMWDTGANICSISRHTAKRLHLEIKETRGSIKTGNGIKSGIELTTVDFLQPDGSTTNVRCDIIGDDEPFDFVVSMEIISLGNFSIKATPAGGFSFTFEYPPK